MGIQGLLRNLHPLLVPPPSHPSNQQHHGDESSNNSSNRPRKQQPQPPQRNNSAIRHNIRQFSQKSLAIDASSWLHKAGYTCAERLVESHESNTRDPIAETKYCKYMLDRCTELLDWAHIDKIYLVFDGIRVPLKSGTNASRESKRQSNLREARRLSSMGRKKEASEKYRNCVKGTAEMARVVAGAVEARWGKDDKGMDGNVRVKCVWSPYEADAQLAKLCVDGWCHAVVTEDSDVLVYSAVTRKPFPIIYKLDRKDGSCDVVTMDWLVNPSFLASLNGSSNSGSSSRRRRRRGRDRDLDYIYNDSPLDEDVERDNENNDEEAAAGNEAESEHCCEVEYDDKGHAPVRRALPSPTSSLSKSSSNNRSKRRGSSSSDGNASGNALLSYLRSFANKEATNPGAGVRLFVQACVLSGCDYVVNRLSKVGPVTAFKIVKETSHRDPAVRFERVLKSLPAGSKLIAEVGDKSSEDGDDEELDRDDDEDNDDFLSQPDNDRDAKEKYEELLSKSEAVFYYHLAKELDTGKIMPLVAHKPSESGGEEGNALEVDESFRPCIERFEPAGLTFVGSAAEAIKNKLEPLLPITGQTHSRRPAFHQQNNNNGGWMSTNKHNGGPVHNYQKNASHYRQQPKNTAPLSIIPPKETSLQRFLKGPQKTTTGTTIRNSHKSMNAGIIKSAGGNVVNNDPKSKEAAHKSHASLTTTNAPVRRGPNLFAGYAHAASTKTDKTTKKSPLPTPDHRATDKAMMKSPISSPVKFDYGGYTPQDTCSKKAEPKLSVDANTTSNAATSNISKPAELLEVDGDDESEKAMTQPTTSSEVQESANDSNAFEYEIVPESPPTNAGFLSRYIQGTKSCDSGRLGPRRVSTSPPKHFNNNGDMDIENSSENVIELIDLSQSESVVNENQPNFRLPPKIKSSVNKQPFKSPYPTASHQGNTTAFTSRNKNTRTTSSSALLAGFARQEKMNSSSAAGIAKRKSRFFPIKTSNKKPTPSLKDFF